LQTSPAGVVENHAHDNPALLHHFATEAQQKNAAGLGMWLFLAQEVMFFGGMFCAYLVYRYKYFADFGSASQQLDIKLGAINTVVLICSSLTVVLAVRAAQLGKRMALVFWLLATIVLGQASAITSSCPARKISPPPSASTPTPVMPKCISLSTSP
jgi:cytochrome c oxidase subunit III